VYLRHAGRWDHRAEGARSEVPQANRATVTPDAQREKFMKKKLTLSKETLRTLDEKELSLVVGGAGQSGANTPPNGGPNTCPNTKGPGNSCT